MYQCFVIFFYLCMFNINVRWTQKGYPVLILVHQLINYPLCPFAFLLNFQNIYVWERFLLPFFSMLMRMHSGQPQLFL